LGHPTTFWRSCIPLHATHSKTQLAFADAFLKSNPKTLVVGIDIGANDVQALVNGCGGMTEIKCTRAIVSALRTD